MCVRLQVEIAVDAEKIAAAYVQMEMNLYAGSQKAAALLRPDAVAQALPLPLPLLLPLILTLALALALTLTRASQSTRRRGRRSRLRGRLWFSRWSTSSRCRAALPSLTRGRAARAGSGRRPPCATTRRSLSRRPSRLSRRGVAISQRQLRRRRGWAAGRRRCRAPGTRRGTRWLIITPRMRTCRARTRTMAGTSALSGVVISHPGAWPRSRRGWSRWP